MPANSTTTRSAVTSSTAAPLPAVDAISGTDQVVMFTVVALYAALLVLSLGRFVHRFLFVEGCAPSRWRRRALAGALLILTAIYSTSRAVLLAMSALGVLNATSDGLISHFETTIPAALFLLLQTVMLLKWERHVRTLTLQLHNMNFQLGVVLIWTSVVLSVIMMAATAVAIADHAAHFTSMSDVTWNHVLTCVCGLAYTFNGVAFIVLGVMLRRLWRPVRVESQRAARRALLIAAVFGTLCVVRGLLLISFFLDQTQQLGEAYHSPLGPTLVLLMECVCLMVVGILYATPGSGESDDSDAGAMSSVGEHQPFLPAAVEARKGFDSGALPDAAPLTTSDRYVTESAPPSSATPHHMQYSATTSSRQPHPDDWQITSASARAVGSALDVRAQNAARTRSF